MEYLINKYKNFVWAKARSYFFLIGADREDIIQEGGIGLYYRLSGISAWTSCHRSVLCRTVHITRQIITAIKTATRQKHILVEFICFSEQTHL